MKYKFIALSIITAAMLTSTACSMRSLDTKEVKVIEKTNTEAVTKGDSGSTKSTNDKNSDLNEKGEVLQKDTEEYIKSIISNRATEVLTALKNKDTESFSKTVHPVKGVRFSPYAYVNESADLIFSADKIKVIDSDVSEYLWGNYDGSGEPIRLTFSDYYEKFIYDSDFINAKEVGYNKSIGKGNTTNNSFQVYNNSIIIEYHFPGFNPEYSGMDWKSLRLVFEKFNDSWYVVGIIHDQWTI
jgi:hypothetical protein